MTPIGSGWSPSGLSPSLSTPREPAPDAVQQFADALRPAGESSVQTNAAILTAKTRANPPPHSSAVYMFEDGARELFSQSDLGFDNEEWEQLLTLRVTTANLPEGARLQFAGVDVTPPLAIPRDQLTSLVLLPAPGTTSTFIKFDVQYADGTWSVASPVLEVKSLKVYEQADLLAELGAHELESVRRRFRAVGDADGVMSLAALHEASFLVYFRRNLIDQSIRQSIDANAQADTPDWVDF